MSDEIRVPIIGEDRLSDVLKTAADNVDKTTKEMAAKAKAAHDKMASSTGEVVKGFNQLGVAAFAVVEGIDSMEKSQVAADRANLTVRKSTEAVENAQTALSDAIRKYGSGSDQAKQASDRLAIAQQQLEINTQRADIAVNQVSDSHTRFALSVIPTVFSGIDGITRVQKSWTEATKEGSIISGAFSTAQDVLTGKMTLATLATNISAAAHKALNFVLEMNPIFKIVAVLALLTAGLVWAYQNIEPFRNAVDALGRILMDKLRPIIDTIVGAFQRLGDFWNWLTGQTEAANAAQTRAIEEATQAQLADIEKRYAVMEATAAESNRKQVDEASKKWLDQLGVEATGFDKVIEEYGKHYDKLQADISSALDAQLRDIKDAYGEQIDVVKDALGKQEDAIKEAADAEIDATQEKYGKIIEAAQTNLDNIRDAYRAQTDAIKEQYQSQLNETSTYYDNLIGIVEDGLSEITDARNKDLADLELNFLLQKEAADNAYAAGEMTKEQYEKTVSDLEKTYNDTRSAKSQDYRIKELQYEEAHAGELEALQADKKAAVTKIQEAEDTALRALEDRYMASEKAAKLELEALKREEKETLKALKEDSAAEIKRIQEEANAEILRLQTEQAADELVAKGVANAQMNLLEGRRKTDIAAIRAEMKMMEDKFQADLSKMEADKAAERNAVVQKAEADRKVIEDKGHADSLTLMGTFKNNVVTKWGEINTALGTAWGLISTASKTTWDGLTKGITDGWTTFKNGIAGTWATINTSLSTAWGNILTTASSIWGGITGWINEAINAALKYAGIDTTKKDITKKDTIDNTFTDLTKGVTGAIQDVIDTITKTTDLGDYIDAVIRETTTQTPTRSTYTASGRLIEYGAAEGFEGLVTQPTPIIVGEGGSPEWVSITPMGRGGGGRPTTINNTVNLTIEGSADERTAKLAAELILRQLRKY